MMLSCSTQRKESLCQTKSSESNELITEMQGLRKMIEQLFEVNKQLPIPIGLRKVLQETFCCCICRCTMVPPVIFGRCCKSLIGCQSCVNRWFWGDSGLMQQSCPKCRTERAYAETCIFKGIDDLLAAIHPLVQSDVSISATAAEEDN